MGFELLSEWKAEDGRTRPESDARVQCSQAPARLHVRPGHPLLVSAGADTGGGLDVERRTTHPRVRANRRLSAPFSSATSSPTANTSVPKHSTCGGMPAFAAPYTNSGKVTEGPATNEVIT